MHSLGLKRREKLRSWDFTGCKERTKKKRYAEQRLGKMACCGAAIGESGPACRVFDKFCERSELTPKRSAPAYRVFNKFCERSELKASFSTVLGFYFKKQEKQKKHYNVNILQLWSKIFHYIRKTKNVIFKRKIHLRQRNKRKISN